MYLFPFYFYILILEREGEKGGGETETDRYRPVVSPIDAFTVDSCMYPDQGLNLHPWRTGMMLQPTELPG